MSDTMMLDVWVLARVIGGAIDEAVAPSGLVGREYVLYALVDGGGPTTPTELARRSGVPATTISKVLRRMTTRGDLAEEENPEDARSRLLRLTQSGEATLDSAHAGFAALADDVAAELGDEVHQVAWSLDRLRYAVERAAGIGTGRPETVRPDEATAHAVRYVGRPLTAAEEQEVAQFIGFIRRND